MIWLNPAALIALALVSAPILIHILVRRRAERFAFPTLRFLRPTRLAAIRRHVLEDVLLLVVRAAMLAAAVAALAGPLIVTTARRQLWQRRIVRATVVDTNGPDGARTFALDGARAFPGFAGETARPATARLAEAPEARRPQASGTAPSDQPFRSQTFATPSLADGIGRAVAWLETAPPARRELAIVSPFAIGSLTPADLAGVPVDVGVRLERSGSLPPTGTMSFGRVLTSAGPLDREVTLAGPATAVREVSPSAAALEPSPWPIDVLASPAARSTADAAVAAVLAQRVWAPAPDRRAQLVLLDAGGFPMNPGVAPSVMSAVSTAGPVRVAWMADAIARITRDADLQAAARRVPSGVSDSRFTATPWQLVAEAANGEPLVCAASAGPRILVLSAASAANVVTPILMRAIANALATMPDLQRAELVPIADEVLRPWSRPAVLPATPRINTVDDDDRRWFWLAALGLLAIEMWMRRTRRDAASESDVARVA